MQRCCSYQRSAMNGKLGISLAAGTEFRRSLMTNLSREVRARRSRIRKIKVHCELRPLAASSCSILHAALLGCGRLRGPLLLRASRTFLAAAVSQFRKYSIISRIHRTKAPRGFSAHQTYAQSQYGLLQTRLVRQRPYSFHVSDVY